MASANLVAPLLSACAAVGVTLLDADKAKIEAVVDNWADTEANTVVSALAAHIVMHGVAGMLQDPLRNAVTGSEPTIDQEINSNVDAGLSEITAVLEHAAQPSL